MSETVEDILAEMRNMGMTGCRFGSSSIMDFADRIEAAHKRDLQSMCESGERDMQTAVDEVARLHEENERLKSELEWSDKQRAIAKSFHDVAVAERDSERRSVDMLRQDVARLKAALKPVLEVGWVEKRYNSCSGIVPTKDLNLVVREAQSIYNGGTK